MKRFHYSTVEITGTFRTLEAIIFKWTAKPRYNPVDHNFCYTRQQDEAGHTQEDIALEGHPRIEERIKRVLTEIYGGITRECIREFEREVLSKFLSNKTSIERVEQDLYEFLDIEVPKFKESKQESQKPTEDLTENSTDKSDIERLVLQGHPIVCEEFVGIGVAEPLMSSIFAGPGKFRTNVMFPGVCRTVYNSEIEETIEELGIRLATRKDIDYYTKDIQEVEFKIARRLGYTIDLPGSSTDEVQRIFRNLDATPDFEEKYELIKFLKRYLMVIS